MKNSIIVGVIVIAVIASLSTNVIAITPPKSVSIVDLNTIGSNQPVTYTNTANGNINLTIVKQNYTMSIPEGFNFKPTPSGQYVFKPTPSGQYVAQNMGSDLSLKGMPTYREDVIVYFKEMPSSLQDFASAHGVKLIFSKPDIKMAAFETTPTSQPGKKSAITQNFVASVSSDPLVESAELDGFMFIDPSVNYTSQPIIKTPEDMEKSNAEYTPNEVTVGFWKIPPSVEEFGAKYGGTLINSSFSVNYGLKFATFNTNNVTSFIKNVSTDPYVRYANVNPTVQMDGYIYPDDPGKIQVIDLSIN